MKSKNWGFLAMACVAAPFAANSQTTTLDYQGSVFTNVSDSGNASFPDVPVLASLMGDVVLAVPLGANLNNAQVVPTAFAFNAPLINSQFFSPGYTGSSASFAFSTNNAGTITGWSVDLSFTYLGTNSPSGNTIVLGPSGDTYTGFGSTPSGCGTTGCSVFIQEGNTKPGVWSVPQQAPEIDPATAAGGVTLLLGSLAVLRGGRRLRY